MRTSRDHSKWDQFKAQVDAMLGNLPPRERQRALNVLLGPSTRSDIEPVRERRWIDEQYGTSAAESFSADTQDIDSLVSAVMDRASVSEPWSQWGGIGPATERRLQENRIYSIADLFMRWNQVGKDWDRLGQEIGVRGKQLDALQDVVQRIHHTGEQVRLDENYWDEMFRKQSLRQSDYTIDQVQQPRGKGALLYDDWAAANLPSFADTGTSGQMARSQTRYGHMRSETYGLGATPAAPGVVWDDPGNVLVRWAGDKGDVRQGTVSALLHSAQTRYNRDMQAEFQRLKKRDKSGRYADASPKQMDIRWHSQDAPNLDPSGRPMISVSYRDYDNTVETYNILAARAPDWSQSESMVMINNMENSSGGYILSDTIQIAEGSLTSYGRFRFDEQGDPMGLSMRWAGNVLWDALYNPGAYDTQGTPNRSGDFSNITDELMEAREGWINYGDLSQAELAYNRGAVVRPKKKTWFDASGEKREGLVYHDDNKRIMQWARKTLGNPYLGGRQGEGRYYDIRGFMRTVAPQTRTVYAADAQGRQYPIQGPAPMEHMKLDPKRGRLWAETRGHPFDIRTSPGRSAKYIEQYGTVGEGHDPLVAVEGTTRLYFAGNLMPEGATLVHAGRHMVMSQQRYFVPGQRPEQLQGDFGLTKNQVYFFNNYRPEEMEAWTTGDVPVTDQATIPGLPRFDPRNIYMARVDDVRYDVERRGTWVDVAKGQPIEEAEIKAGHKGMAHGVSGHPLLPRDVLAAVQAPGEKDVIQTALQYWRFQDKQAVLSQYRQAALGAAPVHVDPWTGQTYGGGTLGFTSEDEVARTVRFRGRDGSLATPESWQRLMALAEDSSYVPDWDASIAEQAALQWYFGGIRHEKFSGLVMDQEQLDIFSDLEQRRRSTFIESRVAQGMTQESAAAMADSPEWQQQWKFFTSKPKKQIFRNARGKAMKNPLTGEPLYNYTVNARIPYRDVQGAYIGARQGTTTGITRMGTELMDQLFENQPEAAQNLLLRQQRGEFFNPSLNMVLARRMNDSPVAEQMRASANIVNLDDPETAAAFYGEFAAASEAVAERYAGTTMKADMMSQMAVRQWASTSAFRGQFLGLGSAVLPGIETISNYLSVTSEGNFIANAGLGAFEALLAQQNYLQTTAFEGTTEEQTLAALGTRDQALEIAMLNKGRGLIPFTDNENVRQEAATIHIEGTSDIARGGPVPSGFEVMPQALFEQQLAHISPETAEETLQASLKLANRKPHKLGKGETWKSALAKQFREGLILTDTAMMFPAADPSVFQIAQAIGSEAQYGQYMGGYKASKRGVIQNILDSMLWRKDQDADRRSGFVNFGPFQGLQTLTRAARRAIVGRSSADERGSIIDKAEALERGSMFQLLNPAYRLENYRKSDEQTMAGYEASQESKAAMAQEYNTLIRYFDQFERMTTRSGGMDWGERFLERRAAGQIASSNYQLAIDMGKSQDPGFRFFNDVYRNLRIFTQPGDLSNVNPWLPPREGFEKGAELHQVYGGAPITSQNQFARYMLGNLMRMGMRHEGLGEDALATNRATYERDIWAYAQAFTPRSRHGDEAYMGGVAEFLRGIEGNYDQAIKPSDKAFWSRFEKAFGYTPEQIMYGVHDAGTAYTDLAPLPSFLMGAIGGRSLDSYEQMLSEWAEEHPNVDPLSDKAPKNISDIVRHQGGRLLLPGNVAEMANVFRSGVRDILQVHKTRLPLEEWIKKALGIAGASSGASQGMEAAALRMGGAAPGAAPNIAIQPPAPIVQPENIAPEPAPEAIAPALVGRDPRPGFLGELDLGITRRSVIPGGLNLTGAIQATPEGEAEINMLFRRLVPHLEDALGTPDRDARIGFMQTLFGRKDIASVKDLTLAEARSLESALYSDDDGDLIANEENIAALRQVGQDWMIERGLTKTDSQYLEDVDPGDVAPEYRNAAGVTLDQVRQGVSAASGGSGGRRGGRPPAPPPPREPGDIDPDAGWKDRKTQLMFVGGGPKGFEAINRSVLAYQRLSKFAGRVEAGEDVQPEPFLYNDWTLLSGVHKSMERRLGAMREQDERYEKGFALPPSVRMFEMPEDKYYKTLFYGTGEGEGALPPLIRYGELLTRLHNINALRIDPETGEGGSIVEAYDLMQRMGRHRPFARGDFRTLSNIQRFAEAQGGGLAGVVAGIRQAQQGQTGDTYSLSPEDDLRATQFAGVHKTLQGMVERLERRISVGGETEEEKAALETVKGLLGGMDQEGIGIVQGYQADLKAKLATRARKPREATFRPLAESDFARLTTNVTPLVESQDALTELAQRMAGGGQMTLEEAKLVQRRVRQLGTVQKLQDRLEGLQAADIATADENLALRNLQEQGIGGIGDVLTQLHGPAVSVITAKELEKAERKKTLDIAPRSMTVRQAAEMNLAARTALLRDDLASRSGLVAEHTQRGAGGDVEIAAGEAVKSFSQMTTAIRDLGEATKGQVDLLKTLRDSMDKTSNRYAEIEKKEQEAAEARARGVDKELTLEPEDELLKGMVDEGGGIKSLRSSLRDSIELLHEVESGRIAVTRELPDRDRGAVLRMRGEKGRELRKAYREAGRFDDFWFDPGDSGALRGVNRLAAGVVGGGGRFLENFFTPQGMWAYRMATGMFVEPGLRAARQFSAESIGRTTALAATGTISGADALSGQTGEMLRRQARSEMLQYSFGQTAYNAYAPFLDAAQAPAVAALGKIGMTTVGPAAGLGYLAARLTGSGPVGWGIAALTGGTLLATQSATSKDDFLEMGKGMFGSWDAFTGHLGDAFANFTGDDDRNWRRRAGSKGFRVGAQAVLGGLLTVEDVMGASVTTSRGYGPFNRDRETQTFGSLYSQGELKSAIYELYIEDAQRQGISAGMAGNVFGSFARYNPIDNVGDYSRFAAMRPALYQLAIQGVDPGALMPTMMGAMQTAPADFAQSRAQYLQAIQSLINAPNTAAEAVRLQYAYGEVANINAMRNLIGEPLLGDQWIEQFRRADGTIDTRREQLGRAGEEWALQRTAQFGPQFATTRKAQIAQQWTEQGGVLSAGALALYNAPDLVGLGREWAARTGISAVDTTGLLESIQATMISPLQPYAGMGQQFQTNVLGFLGGMGAGGYQFFADEGLGDIRTERFLRTAQEMTGAGIDFNKLAQQRFLAATGGVQPTDAQIRAERERLAKEMAASADISQFEKESGSLDALANINLMLRQYGQEPMSWSPELDVLRDPLKAHALTALSGVSGAMQFRGTGAEFLLGSPAAQRAEALWSTDPAEAIRLSEQLSRGATYYDTAVARGFSLGPDVQSALSEYAGLSTAERERADMIAQGDPWALSNRWRELTPRFGQRAIRFQTLDTATGQDAFRFGISPQEMLWLQQTKAETGRRADFGLQQGDPGFAEFRSGGTMALENLIRNAEYDLQKQQYAYQVRQRDIGWFTQAGGVTGLTGQGFAVGGGLGALGQLLTPLLQQAGFGAFNAGNGMNMWQLQDWSTQISREQQMFSYQQEGQQLGLQRQQFEIEGQRWEEQYGRQQRRSQWSWDFEAKQLGMSRERTMTQLQWSGEDIAYQRGMSSLQFGWQLEDFDTQIRYARGRERRLLMRQRDRAVIAESMQQGRFDTEEGRLDKRKEWAEEEQKMREEHHKKSVEWQKEDMALSLRYHQQDRQLQEQRLRLSEQAHYRQLQWMQQTWQIEDQRRLIERQVATAQYMDQVNMQTAVWATSENTRRWREELSNANLALNLASTYIQTLVNKVQLLGAAVGSVPTSAGGAGGAVGGAIGGAIGAIGDAIGGLGTNTGQRGDKWPGWNTGGSGTINYNPLNRAHGWYNYQGTWYSFQQGGYTGDGAPWDVAGLVHKQEHVVPAGGSLVLRGDNPESVGLLREIRDLLRAIRDKGLGQLILNNYSTKTAETARDLLDATYQL